MRVARFLLVFALCTLVTTVALADGIEIPRCPEGWDWQQTGHGGACFPTACTNDSACSDGASCEPRAYCYSRRLIPSGPRMPHREDPSSWMWYPQSDSQCVHTCPGEQECRTATVCVPGTTPAPRNEDSRGCAVGHASTPSPAPFALAGLWVFAYRRRR